MSLALVQYERDNLGDLLFLLVTEPYLTGAEVVAAAPFAADMTAQLDRRVHAYAPLLRNERFDAIWTAGGQVGAVDARRAYRMSAPPRRYRRYARGSDRRRAAEEARSEDLTRLAHEHLTDLAQRVIRQARARADRVA